MTGDRIAVCRGLEFLRGALDLARAGRTAELTDLVDHGLPANLTAANGDNLLILAAYYNHPATVSALLVRGADPNRINDRGQTALGAAVFRQSEASVRHLLRFHADPHAGGRSACDIARFFRLDHMAALLQNADEPVRAPTPPPP